MYFITFRKLLGNHSLFSSEQFKRTVGFFKLKAYNVYVIWQTSELVIHPVTVNSNVVLHLITDSIVAPTKTLLIFLVADVCLWPGPSWLNWGFSCYQFERCLPWTLICVLSQSSDLIYMFFISGAARTEINKKAFMRIENFNASWPTFEHRVDISGCKTHVALTDRTKVLVMLFVFVCLFSSSLRGIFSWFCHWPY